MLSMDSPHPRGWTHHPHLRLDHRPGFPAPAGMDPHDADSADARTRIPRTRGDGPTQNGGEYRAVVDSPHPRGWTPAAGSPVARRSGFPAPAGMDRFIASPYQIRTWIPRTRGDGPCPARFRRWRGADSPHPRGWTRHDLAARRLRVGFPAPAGMDRRGPPGVGAGARIPRTRGDGPRRATPSASMALDSPHPRGWTLAEALRQAA